MSRFTPEATYQRPDPSGEVAKALVAVEKLRARGWRPIAIQHLDFITKGGVPYERQATPVRVVESTGQALKAKCWVPEWAAILLQIACIRAERAPPSQIAGGAGLRFTAENAIPSDRHAAIVVLLARATKDTALQQRLTGISAWSDLETDEDTYLSTGFQFWFELAKDAARWAKEQR